MKRLLLLTALLSAFCWPAIAQTPAILLEACNAMEPASKRLECLRAANGVRSDSSGSYGGVSNKSQPAYAVPPPAAPSRYAPATSATTRSSEGPTCYVGPRGGTYTITASGRKNYGGC